MKGFEMTLQIIRNIFGGHLIIKLILTAIIMDSFFGCVRAFKTKKTNSSIGIDGVIRKICVIAGLTFMVLIDYMLNLNLTEFIYKILPEKTFEYIPLKHMGLTETFGLLFLAYESMSVLKNMYMCNLPVKKIWLWADKFLHNYTDELPSTDLTQEETIRQIATNITESSKSLKEKQEAEA
ncbi:MAG: phage holin family protein [Lachnospiraceae bacterium]|nr:phage holin family protein [Lachnospiraceae bacterium]